MNDATKIWYNLLYMSSLIDWRLLSKYMTVVDIPRH